MDFKGPNDALVHSLKNGGGGRCYEDELNISQVGNRQMHGTVANKRAVFWLSARNFWSSLQIHSSNISLPI